MASSPTAAAAEFPLPLPVCLALSDGLRRAITTHAAEAAALAEQFPDLAAAANKGLEGDPRDATGPAGAHFVVPPPSVLHCRDHKSPPRTFAAARLAADEANFRGESEQGKPRRAGGQRCLYLGKNNQPVVIAPQFVNDTRHHGTPVQTSLHADADRSTAAPHSLTYVPVHRSHSRTGRRELLLQRARDLVSAIDQGAMFVSPVTGARGRQVPSAKAPPRPLQGNTTSTSTPHKEHHQFGTVQRPTSPSLGLAGAALQRSEETALPPAVRVAMCADEAHTLQASARAVTAELRPATLAALLAPISAIFAAQALRMDGPDGRPMRRVAAAHSLDTIATLAQAEIVTWEGGAVAGSPSAPPLLVAGSFAALELRQRLATTDLLQTGRGLVQRALPWCWSLLTAIDVVIDSRRPDALVPRVLRGDPVRRDAASPVRVEVLQVFLQLLLERVHGTPLPPPVRLVPLTLSREAAGAQNPGAEAVCGRRQCTDAVARLFSHWFPAHASPSTVRDKPKPDDNRDSGTTPINSSDAAEGPGPLDGPHALVLLAAASRVPTAALIDGTLAVLRPQWAHMLGRRPHDANAHGREDAAAAVEHPHTTATAAGAGSLNVSAISATGNVSNHSHNTAHNTSHQASSGSPRAAVASAGRSRPHTASSLASTDVSRSHPVAAAVAEEELLKLQRAEELASPFASVGLTRRDPLSRTNNDTYNLERVLMARLSRKLVSAASALPDDGGLAVPHGERPPSAASNLATHLAGLGQAVPAHHSVTNARRPGSSPTGAGATVATTAESHLMAYLEQGVIAGEHRRQLAEAHPHVLDTLRRAASHAHDSDQGVAGMSPAEAREAAKVALLVHHPDLSAHEADAHRAPTGRTSPLRQHHFKPPPSPATALVLRPSSAQPQPSTMFARRPHSSNGRQQGQVSRPASNTPRPVTASERPVDCMDLSVRSPSQTSNASPTAEVPAPHPSIPSPARHRHKPPFPVREASRVLAAAEQQQAQASSSVLRSVSSAATTQLVPVEAARPHTTTPSVAVSEKTRLSHRPVSAQNRGTGVAAGGGGLHGAILLVPTMAALPVTTGGSFSQSLSLGNLRGGSARGKRF